MNLIGFLYQDSSGKFFRLHLMGALNKYLKEFEEISKRENEMICRWVVKRKY